tara:strand:- start:2413 stop:2637 length:225 start_codon:yes stop_codon:yes gene_type:complete
MRDMQTQTEELPPPTQNDAAAMPEQQPTLTMAVAGTLEISATDDGQPVLLILMADGSVRWHSPQVSDSMEVSGA